MGAEIERKFRVRVVPDGPGLGPGARLRQGYVAVDGTAEVRVRMTDGGSSLTIKSGSGLARTEVDLPLEEVEAEELWEISEGRRIDKVRHRMVLGDGAIAEVDCYGGTLAGLWIVEVEFTSEATAAAFVAPGWFGEELTGRREWSNAVLAQRGRPTR